MNGKGLPQTIFVGDLTVTQATNCHVSICKDGRRVFHAPVDRPLDFDELMECVKMYKVMASIAPEPYQSRPENYIQLRPRGVGERGGYFCMPLKKNVPEGHPNWKMVRCPECGAECWRLPQADLAEAQGVAGLCTMCAFRKGMEN